jgi:hypothetical protein
MGSRQDHYKQKVITHLRQMPIVQVACQRAGISRATYYRWFKEDEQFAADCVEALSNGVSLINDLAESKLIQGINEGKPVFVMGWLNNHHRSYGNDRLRRYKAESDSVEAEYRQALKDLTASIHDFMDTEDELDPPDE